MKPVVLIHHSANREHRHAEGSPRALNACLEAGARVVEVDLSPLVDGEFALLHGPTLEGETTGIGPVADLSPEQIRGLHYVRRGMATDEPVGLLAEALELVAGHSQPVELQLDLKPYSPLSEDTLSCLVADLEPVKDRVRVSSGADWILRRLSALDPDLPLGFDPLLYLEFDPGEGRDPSDPPHRLGSFGYWDDHPLASRRWGPTAEYLAARAEALWVQAPVGALWYIAAHLLIRALDDGFDWIADLHRRGAEVVAWTLDANRPRHLAIARRLVDQGVDRITTNNAPALARVLGVPTVY